MGDDSMRQNIFYNKKDGTIITRYVFEQEDDFDSESEAVNIPTENLGAEMKRIENECLKWSFCSDELISILKQNSSKSDNILMPSTSNNPNADIAFFF